MRSVTKHRGTKEGNGDKINFSGNQVVELVNTAADVVKSSFDWLKEIEKTKQIAIEAKVKMTESNNRLASELAEFEKDMFKIQKEYELESKKIDNEYNFKIRKLEIIEDMIKGIDKLEITINIYQDKEGLTSSYVMNLFDKLHEQKLTSIEMIKYIGLD